MKKEISERVWEERNIIDLMYCLVQKGDERNRRKINVDYLLTYKDTATILFHHHVTSL